MKFEIVGFDNKAQPAGEPERAARRPSTRACATSSRATARAPRLAISDAVAKHNERNPGKEVRVPQLRRGRPRPDQRASAATGTSAWTPTPSMKMEALTTFMKDQPDIKKVYLINQNYSHGQQVAKYAKERSDAQAPRRRRSSATTCTRWRRCSDFAPYVAKIKASGADTVITGNWGSDLTLLIKAANDAGLNVKFYTYYAGVTGTPTAHGRRRRRRACSRSAYGHSNMRRRDRQADATSSRRSSTTTSTPAPIYHALRDARRARWPRPRPPTR